MQGPGPRPAYSASWAPRANLSPCPPCRHSSLGNPTREPSSGSHTMQSNHIHSFQTRALELGESFVHYTILDTLPIRAPGSNSSKPDNTARSPPSLPIPMPQGTYDFCSHLLGPSSVALLYMQRFTQLLANSCVSTAHCWGTGSE